MYAKAASKAQKKISKVEDKKKKASKASDLFGSSGDESSAAKKTETESKKSPRSSNKKKQTSTDSESETEQVSKHKVKSTFRRARKKSLSICQKQSHQRKMGGRGRWMSGSVTLTLSRAAHRGKNPLVRRRSHQRSLLLLIIFSWG